MPGVRTGRGSPPTRAEIIETSVIVGLAALVVIKGAGAVGGVFLGLGQMMAALVSVAMH